MSLKSNQSTGDVAIYGRLLAYVTPYWGAFLLSMAGFILYSAANVGFAQLVGFIVDSLSGSNSLGDFSAAPALKDWLGADADLDRTLIPLLIVAIVLARGVGTFVGNYFINLIGTNLVHTLRCELFDQLLLLPSRFFDKNTMGHLVAKVTFHVTQVTGAATDAVRVVVREGFTVIGYLSFLFYLNWKLTLVFLAVAPLIALLVNYAGKRFRRISERIQDSMGDVTQVATEAVQGYEVVRTFGGTEYERDRFHLVSNDNRRQSMKMVVTSSIATPVVQLVVAFSLALLVWLVLDPVFMANMTPGDVVAFISAGGLLAKPIRQLSEINSTIQKGLAAAQDIFVLFDEPREVDDGTRPLSEAEGRIEFRNVTFRYEPDGDDVLRDVSFTVNPGETVALVGRSGSGKSTLVSLIPRFYAPRSGQIFLDGVPLSDYVLADLRSQISIVSQDVTLFNDSVANNIAYGSLRSASPQKLRSAADKAHATGFISALEHGFETTVGDDGVLLSGGQRQRIAIARAFLKDAPILILDEATSALDSESERSIQQALEAVVEGRTTFVIAHRLSTIEKADRILVVDQGRIVEQGSHAELIERGGAYANLHRHQLGDEDQAEPLPPTTIAQDFTPVPTTPEPGFQWLPDDFDPLVHAWYADALWVRLLAPVAFVFRHVARVRRARQSARAWQAPVPVIVIGNINVGGTGKTPLVMWLAHALSARGLKPGIVSRGYGGLSTSWPLCVDASSDPVQCGDEASMIARRTGRPVVVAPDRVAAVKMLLAETDCDVVLSDDGLQHYAMGRQVEVVVVDGLRGLGNGLCLPAGPLREPPSRLAEVDFVVVNGERTPALPMATETVQMNLRPARFVHVTGERSLPAVAGELGESVHAIAGIGHPARFFGTLRQLGYHVIEHQLGDHHRFELSDLAFGDHLPVVMTEKDAVKVRQLNPGLIHDSFWYLEVDAGLPATFVDELVSQAGLEVSAMSQGDSISQPGAAQG